MGTAFHRSYPIPQTGLLLTSTVLAIVPAGEPGIVLPRRGNDAGRGRVAPALPLLPGAAAGLGLAAGPFPPVVPASAAIIAGLAAGLFLLMAVVPMLMAAAPFRSAAAVHSIPAATAVPTAAAISTAAAAAKQ